MAKNRTKFWTLLGSGPGNPEFLTLKAARILNSAEIVLFDEGISASILDFIPDSCEKVGTQGNFSRNSIREVEKISKNRQVIRLKSGEPFLLESEWEELALAREFGFETTYLPGITTMQTMGCYHIPLTHRGLSEGILTIRAGSAGTALQTELSLALQTNSTVVIYQAVRYAAEIAKLYRFFGKENTPAGVIQDFFMAREKLVFTTVGELAGTVRQHRLSAQGLVVIGEVTELGKRAVPESVQSGNV